MDGGRRWPPDNGCRLIDKRDEPFRPKHVFAVGIAEGLGKRLFFHANAPEEGGGNGQDEAEKGQPAAEREAKSNKGEKGAGIRRVANEAIWAGIDELMLLRDGDVDGEEATQVKDRRPAQGNAAEKKNETGHGPEMRVWKFSDPNR